MRDVLEEMIAFHGPQSPESPSSDAEERWVMGLTPEDGLRLIEWARSPDRFPLVQERLVAAGKGPDDESSTLRRNAAFWAGKIAKRSEDPRLRDAFLELLVDSNGPEIILGLEALEQLAHVATSNAVRRFLRDENPEVAWAAASTLGAVGGSDAVRELELLRSEWERRARPEPAALRRLDRLLRRARNV